MAATALPGTRPHTGPHGDQHPRPHADQHPHPPGPHSYQQPHQSRPHADQRPHPPRPRGDQHQNPPGPHSDPYAQQRPRTRTHARTAALPHARPRPGSGRRRPAAPPPPHMWFAERLLGVLTGTRAITSLAGHVRPDAYDRLWNLAGARADWRRRARGHGPAVHRCRVVRVADDALEVCAVVALSAERYRAIAFRLERHTGGSAARHCARGWRCTAVEAR